MMEKICEKEVDSEVSAIRLRDLLGYSYGNHQIVLMLRLYLDESGHSSDERETVYVVGGSLSSLTQWEALEKKWARMLRAYGISQLHMKDFAHFRGEYTGWPDQKRQDLLGEVAEITEAHVDKFIGAVVPMAEYNTLNDQQKNAAGHPYLVAFKDCLLMAGRTALELFALPEKVETFFADSPKLNGKIHELYSKCRTNLYVGERLGPVTWGKPIDIIPLQVADLVAYELNKLGRVRLGGDVDFANIRWPFRNIIMEKIPDFEFYSAYRLEERYPG